jgi:pSer/pThr/pTyr-binding forkhead associated (FHA) protein
MAKLLFIDKNFTGQVCALNRERLSVGRGPENHLVIRDDSVSTKHCEILTHGAEVIVRDLGSRNGTFIDGVRITRQGPVKAGQKVRFGLVEARLQLDPGDGPEEEQSTLTAVHLHAKALKDDQARRRGSPPTPPQAVVQGAETGDPDPGDQPTILLPNAQPAGAGDASRTQPTPGIQPGPLWSRPWFIIALVAAAAVVVSLVLRH